MLHLGIDSPAARERFRQERSILAGLEHPNIARLLDGGETESGLSYIVLEYVDGQSIVEYCEQRKLGREERLRLFLQVCAAVQYAHQNLIVHRDLKPENILVTREGSPKLLDFGIAKLMEPGALQTMTGFQALTPQYASSEQIRGQVVTTVTDVYSLGMVMYELLTGRRPYKVDATSFSEIARTVCEVEPAEPGLGGDLDNILFMALRKEAARRYALVQDFTGDLERFLSHRPVAARPDSIRYRSSKFLRRNRYGVIAAALLLLALGLGATATLWQARRAERRFQQVRSLASSFIFEVHDKIAELAGSTEARELVVRKGLEYLDSLAAEAGGDDALQMVAGGYLKVGDVQGNMHVPNLAKYDEALKSYEKALLIAKRLAAARNNNVARQSLLAKAHLLKGQVLSFLGRPEAEQNLQEATRIAESMPPDAGLPRLELLRSAYFAMSFLARRQGAVAKELANSQRTLEVSDQLARAEPTDQHLYNKALAAETFARAQAYSGGIDQAITHYKEATKVFAALHERDPKNATYFRDYGVSLGVTASQLGDARYPNTGDTAAGLEYYRRSLELAKELYQKDPANERRFHDLAELYCGLGVTVRDRDATASVEYLRQSIGSMDSAPASVMENLWHRMDQAEYVASIAYPLRKLKRFERSSPVFGSRAFDLSRTGNQTPIEHRVATEGGDRATGTRRTRGGVGA